MILSIVITLLVFLVILSVLVLIHEAGHFFVAKWFGIKVEEFGFGLPPRAFGKKRGETIFSVNWLPIGGFVKLYGEDDAGGGRVVSRKSQVVSSKASDKLHPTKDIYRAFFARPVWQRALVIVAGVVMNAILACLIFYIYFAISNFKAALPLLDPSYHFLVAHQQNVNVEDTSPVVIDSVAGHSPAEKAGIRPLSRILSVNNVVIKSHSQFFTIVNRSKGKQIIIAWEDIYTDQVHKAALTPRLHPPKDEGAMGVSFGPMALLSYDTPRQKLLSGIVHPINLMGYTFDILGKLIGISIKEKSVAPVGSSVSGPVGIGVAVNKILQLPDAKEITLQLFNLAGLLSASLAVFNVLPIPALDGGRLFFILVEGITGRKVNPHFEEKAHSIGMAILLTIILFITIHEIFVYFL